ncbi:MAG: DUF4157 domain-containing protein [Ginsengibacter sp.]
MQTLATSEKTKNNFGVGMHKNKQQPFFSPIKIQPKLTIGPVDDPYEREADAVAEKVMRMPANENTFFKPATNSIQGRYKHCEASEKKLQMKGESVDASKTVPSVVQDVLTSQGQPIDTGARNFMESRFNYDFSNVQIHNDSLAHKSSNDINALAYTHGNHVVFGEGQFQPSTNSGKQLLAHELTHVMQQSPFIHRDENKNPNSNVSSSAQGGSLLTQLVGGHNASTGFNSAGQNAVGIIAVPSQSGQAPFQFMEPGLEVWGHTAVYVRINGRVVVVRGFSINSIADVAKSGMRPGMWNRISSLWQTIRGKAPVDVPSRMMDDAALFSNTNAKTLEYPVTPEFAQQFIAELPPARVPGAPLRYQINNNLNEVSGQGSNCVKWAIKQLQSKFGGTIGRSGEASVAELGSGSSQGQLMRFLKDLLKGRATPATLPNATGEGVAGKMPVKLQIGTWLGRLMQVAAPILEFYSNWKQKIPLGQNIGRTTTVGLDVVALQGLYKSGSKIFGGAGGSRIGGLADLAVNIFNMGAQLLGAPKYVTNVTQAAAELTPSNTIFAGSKGLFDFIYAGATDGTAGLQHVHDEMVKGHSGGMMQGYSMIGDLVSGDAPDIDLNAAAEGDYGIFAEAGVWWGDHIYDWLH